jgi:hypothetical protein
MNDHVMLRAVDRVWLACKALDAANSDLRVARELEPTTVDDDTAEALDNEVARVCQLADELARRWQLSTTA